ncbi:hypothetical protein [Peterkaempfera bronchialis]|uniref:hypothetical protein n=1 Tax=Peterkaempfera bronchialis TaxID=2126346 RepID=UPI003C2F8082
MPQITVAHRPGPDLGAALREWAASGYSAQPPAAGPRRTAALSSSPARPAHTATPLPPATAAVSPPRPSAGHTPRPF